MSLFYLAACGCLIGLYARLPSSREPRMGLLPMLAIGCGGALMGSFLVGAASDLSVMDIDVLVVLGAVVGALVLLVAAHGYYRLCMLRIERTSRTASMLEIARPNLMELSRTDLEVTPIRTSLPPSL